MNGLTMKKTMLRAGGLLCILLSTAAHAGERTPVAGGGWLTLDKTGLHLHDAANKAVASVALRAKQVDARTVAGAGLAVVLDADTQHALAIRVDLARGALTRLGPLPVTAFGVESLCLYRDRQGLDHLFIAGKDGQAEQWLMQGDTPRLVRRLSMPLEAGQCKVDDATQTLYVHETGVGTWAYQADSEAVPSRRLLPGTARRSRMPGPFLMADAPGASARQPSTAVGRPGPVAIVQPRAQTAPVALLGDVADDPAIWVHPGDPVGSRVLGTNKKQGLMVYDLEGRQTQFLATGRLNNVDVRQGVVFDGRGHDLAVATQRDDNSVVLFGIDGGGVVAELARFPTGFKEVYGICLFQPRAGGLNVVVNDKSGKFLQIRVARTGLGWTGEAVRSFRVASQPEGCVADDHAERLYIGEEKRGVWTLDARAGQAATMQRVLGVGHTLRADVEGLALYHGAGASYLVVSSQGDNSYVVLDAAAPYRVRGKFRVGFNVDAGIDGTSETDGLEVTSKNLGTRYPRGMLVIQDGYKRLPDGPQNFKYVSWDDVARALNL